MRTDHSWNSCELEIFKISNYKVYGSQADSSLPAAYITYNLIFPSN